MPPQDNVTPGLKLIRLFSLTLLGYFFSMLLLWLLGIESIYQHPTPFYALYIPIFPSLAVPGALLGVAITLYWLATQRRTRRPGRTFYLGLALTLLWSLLWLGQYINELIQTRGTDEENYQALLWVFPYHLLAGAIAVLGIYFACYRDHLANLWRNAIKPDFKLDSFTLSTQQRRWVLTALFAFTIAFPMAIAMLRGGPTGISQAYARETYEYIGDIGKTSSITQLFTRYNEIHPHLSMHAKVHPPGPIALLWFFSYFLGNGHMALSIATIVFGALAIIPLFYWARTVTNEATALLCTMLYTLTPSVVLFTATSADILFTPFTLFTLWQFDKSIRTPRIRVALLAGIGYGILIHLKFSLIGIGGYFALVGLYQLYVHRAWRPVFQTAILMVLSALAVVGAIYLYTGFNIIDCFVLAKNQFDLDQHHLDQITPRLTAWTYRFWNPMTWFYFTGIPIALLALKVFFTPRQHKQGWITICLLTLIVLNLLYLARGEGERSALYLFPFLALPAAHSLLHYCKQHQSWTPIPITLAFLAFQCWLTESIFYTYW